MPKWMSENEDKSVKFVENLTDETKLIRAVKESRFWKVRLAAVKKITDQNVLANIAIEHNSDYLENGYEIRKIAIMKLSDEDILTEIIKNDTAKYRYKWKKINLDSRRVVGVERIPACTGCYLATVGRRAGKYD